MKKSNSQTKGGVLSAVISALTAVIILLLAVIVGGNLVRSRYLVVEVVGTSMVHTLENGDIVYSDRGAQPQRGDIVIVDVSEQPDFAGIGTEIIIKRVIAVGGDRIKCDGGVVYLATDGGEYEPLEEDYIEGRNTVEFECTVAEGEIYVMGDNREGSMDSRRVGPLPAEDVLGTVPSWVLGEKDIIKGWESIGDALFGWMRRSPDTKK